MIINKEELELIKEMEVFTKEVFKYYKNIINPIIGDYLILEIIYYDPKDYYAEQRNINIRIYLSSCIKNTTNKDVIKFRIINSLLHELYHSIQHIPDILYKNDKKFRNMIENQAIILTQSYIIQNIIDIQNRWNIELFPNSIEFIFNLFHKTLYDEYCNSMYYYEKFNDIEEFIISYVIKLISSFYNDEDILDLFSETCYNTGTFIIDINIYNNMNKEIIIKKNNIINIECINDLKYVFDYQKYNKARQRISIIEYTDYITHLCLEIKTIEDKIQLCTFNNSSNS